MSKIGFHSDPCTCVCCNEVGCMQFSDLRFTRQWYFQVTACAKHYRSYGPSCVASGSYYTPSGISSLAAGKTTCNISNTLSHLQGTLWSHASFHCQLLNVHIPSRTFDLRQSVVWKVPFTRTKTYGDHTFAFAAADVWNRLPKTYDKQRLSTYSCPSWRLIF